MTRKSTKKYVNQRRASTTSFNHCRWMGLAIVFCLSSVSISQAQITQVYVRLNPDPFAAPYYIFSFEENGASETLELVKGSSYVFLRTDSGHPFNIGSGWQAGNSQLTMTSTSTGYFVDGVASIQRGESLQIDIPNSFSGDTLSYYCYPHEQMVGSFAVIEPEDIFMVDSDDDGVSDNLDAFPNNPNETIDTDLDGVGDNADVFPNNPNETIDTDFDGVGDNSDNCVNTSNTDQLNTDDDATGNACDSDDDNDTVSDDEDDFPIDATETTDSDSDGIGDNADAFPLNRLFTADSDSDGMPNAWELMYGLNPNDPADASSDQDNDGAVALAEFLAGTIPGDRPVSGIAYHWKQHALLESVKVALVGMTEGVANDTTQEAMTNAAGLYAFTQKTLGTHHLTASKAITAGEMGSVISSADALAALKIAVGINPNKDPDGAGPESALPVSPYQYIAADITGDGRVTSADALAILKMAVTLASAEPRRWAFVAEDYTFWDTESDSFKTTRTDVMWHGDGMTLDYPEKSVQNVVGVLMGDVDGSWSAPEGSEAVAETHFTALVASLGGALMQWGLIPDPAAKENAIPEFISKPVFSIVENTRNIGVITAVDSDDDALTFSVSGADAAAVNIDQQAHLTFHAMKDFEAPASNDGDNQYHITVSVSDGKAVKAQDIVISVTDESELNTGPYYPLLEGEFDYTQFEPISSPWAVDEVFSTTSRLWGLKFLSDQLYLTTRQDGVFFLHDLVKDEKYTFDISSKMNLFTEGQGGLFNFDVVKTSPTQYQVYFAASIFSAESGYTLSINRLQLTLIAGSEPEFSDPVELFQGQPNDTTNQHFGGAIQISGDALYATSGDRRCRECAQSVENYNGKILRFQIQEDYSLRPHPANQVNTNTHKEIFSIGHRNPQGIDLVQEFNKIVISEHGPKGGDEVNILNSGLNYGWPRVTLGEEYRGGKIGEEQLPGFEDAITYYVPSIAPRGIVYVEENPLFPELDNSLLVSSLKFEVIVVLHLDTERPRHGLINLASFGRISSMDINATGEIFFVTHSSSGKVYRIR